MRPAVLHIFANGKYVKFDAEGSKKAKALVEKTKKEKDIGNRGRRHTNGVRR